MFKKLFRPQIKAKLIKGGSMVDVKIMNASREQILIILFLTIKRVAETFKTDHRHILNSLISLDKQIVRNTKKEIKKERYGK